MMRRTVGGVMVSSVALILILWGCSGRTQRDTSVYRMGERVHAGGLSYTIFEAEWLTQLGSLPAPRLPQKRFLLVKVNITNGGATETIVPGITLEGPNGELYTELTEGDGVGDWLPPFRRLSPAETREGRIIFDAPPNAYQLRVKEDTDFSKESATQNSALIDVPLSLPGATAVPAKN